MKRFTVALCLMTVLAVSACAQGSSRCDATKAGSCTNNYQADSAFSKSLRK